MLTNKQIHTLLLENKDIKAFQKYVGFKSRQALEFRLASEEPKNNLWGKYVDFILEQKKEVLWKDESLSNVPDWLDSMRVPFAPDEEGFIVKDLGKK